MKFSRALSITHAEADKGAREAAASPLHFMDALQVSYGVVRTPARRSNSLKGPMPADQRQIASLLLTNRDGDASFWRWLQPGQPLSRKEMPRNNDSGRKS